MNNRAGDTAAGPDISVVLPVFNEESGLPELYRRVKAVLVATGLPRPPRMRRNGSAW